MSKRLCIYMPCRPRRMRNLEAVVRRTRPDADDLCRSYRLEKTHCHLLRKMATGSAGSVWRRWSASCTYPALRTPRSPSSARPVRAVSSPPVIARQGPKPITVFIDDTSIIIIIIIVVVVVVVAVNHHHRCCSWYTLPPLSAATSVFCPLSAWPCPPCHGRSTSIRHLFSRTRPSMACTACQTRKVKCDRTRPTCNNCSQRSIPCIYSTERSKRRKLDHNIAPFAGTYRFVTHVADGNRKKERPPDKATSPQNDAADPLTAIPRPWPEDLTPAGRPIRRL